jgi:hypothetical protein
MSTDASQEQIEKMQAFVHYGISKFGKDKIVGGQGDVNSSPDITDEVIRFNGVEDDAYETFKMLINSGEREFCKTNHKPYDTLVVACLRYAAEIGIVTSWRSDGDKEDLYDGMTLYFDIFLVVGA